MNLFESPHYRKAFEHLFSPKMMDMSRHRSLAQLAVSAHIQPSYLTNVIKGRAHFSSDQIYALGDELGIRPEETEFLILLMEWERTSHSRRKERLAERIENLRQQNLRAEKYITAPQTVLKNEDLERYYLDPNVELLHLFLGTESCPQGIDQIAQVWGFSKEYVHEILNLLESLKLIVRKGKWWTTRIAHQHLPRESPLCKPQQMLKRLAALHALQKMPSHRAYTFSASVTMTEQTRLEIQSRFLEFLKQCEDLVKGSAPQELFQIQFDLFPWIDA